MVSIRLHFNHIKSKTSVYRLDINYGGSSGYGRKYMQAFLNSLNYNASN